MIVRSDRLQKYSSARSLVTSGRIFLDANESQAGEAFASYGQRQNRKLLRILAENYGVREDSLLYDRGLDEIISLLFRATCEPGSSVRLFTPTYGMYAVEASIQGLNLDVLPLTDEGLLDLESLKKNPGSPSLVILCRPNNPLGTEDSFFTVTELLKLYKGICPVFIDEAYAEFSSSEEELYPLIESYDLILGRTLSKAYGLAGLRFGCAFARPEWIERLATVQKPYPVPRPVEDYLVSSFGSEIKGKAMTWASEVVANRKNWEKFFGEILGTKSFASQTNFIAFKSERSRDCYEFLRERGIITRFFNPHLLRITIGTDAQLRELAALDWENL